MSLYHSILNSVILPFGDIIFSGSYIKNIKLWNQYGKLNSIELNTIQNKALTELLAYAKLHVPYYKDIRFLETETIENRLKEFPILTKSILRKEVDSLISNKHKKSDLEMNFSSGSSGQQSFTYMTSEHKFYLRALQTYWWSWSGFTIGDKVLQFGIAQKRTFIKQLKDLFYRCYYHKSFGIKEMEFITLANETKARNITYIAGYPSVINQLALSSSKNKNIKGIICFGDKLFKHHEKNIKKAYGNRVKIIDTYGCAEGLLMACRKDLDYYYIMSPHVFIEIVDDHGYPVPDGEMGNILVTCLTNKAMPLIRYKLGDLGIKLPKDKYPRNCDFNYPLLQKIIGRETDVIKTKNGTVLNVHSFTGVFEYFQEIKQYKIIQRDLNSINIEYISDENISKSRLKEIENKFLDLTNSELIIRFSKVKIIEPSHSGKPQIIDTTLV